MLELHCADEGTGLEETVEAWKAAIFNRVQELSGSDCVSLVCSGVSSVILDA